MNDEKKTCEENISTPCLRPGDVLTTGKYFRNTDDSGVKKKSPNSDNGVPPRDGYRATSSCFRWDVGSGLSVTGKDCIKEPKCAVVLDKDPYRYTWVVEIDLRRLSDGIGCRLAAIYDPVFEDDYENPCHFNIAGEDEPLDVIKGQVISFLRKLIPNMGKKPIDDEIKRHYDAVYDFHRIEVRQPLSQTPEQPTPATPPSAGASATP